MSSKQEPTPQAIIIKKAEALAERIKEIEASELPPHIKEQKIAVINSDLDRLAKAYNSLLRN